MLKVIASLTFFILICNYTISQTLGGSSIYNFLNLPASAQISALGGINVSNRSKDLSLSIMNPSLLVDSLSGQVSTNLNAMFAGIKNISVVTALTKESWKTNFALAINVFDYGKTANTDIAGNLLGEFKAMDYVIQIQASRKYLDRWQYGLALKYIHSSYSIYNSSGIAADFGITYSSIDKTFQAGFTAKNMGIQLKRYSIIYEDLPFDVQIGISQRLRKLPLQLSLTAHHLHQFDLNYNTSLSPDNDGFAKKLFDHFIIGGQLYLANKIELSAGYNFLRASEFRLNNGGAGSGISVGIGTLIKKLQIRYAMAFYQTKAYHQVGINFSLKNLEF